MKKGIYELYFVLCDEINICVWKMFFFEEVWLKFVFYIKLSKFCDDVCYRCECFRKQVIDVVIEGEKLIVIEMFYRYLEDVRRG